MSPFVRKVKTASGATAVHALLVFCADSPDAVAAILADDPFVREGLVAQTDVRGWDVVLDPWSA